jgi:hypothetical protein
MDYNEDIGQLMDIFTPCQDYQLVHKQMNSTLFHFIALQHDLANRAQTLKSSLHAYLQILQDIKTKGSKTQIVVTPSYDAGTSTHEAPQAKLSTYRYDSLNSLKSSNQATSASLAESSTSEEKEGGSKSHTSGTSPTDSMMRTKSAEDLELSTEGRSQKIRNTTKKHTGVHSKEHLEVSSPSSNSMREKGLTRSTGFKRVPSPESSGPPLVHATSSRRATAAAPLHSADESEADDDNRRRTPFKISLPNPEAPKAGGLNNTPPLGGGFLTSPNAAAAGARRDWEWDEDDDSEGKIHLATSDFCDVTAGLKDVYKNFQNISKVRNYNCTHPLH